MTKSIFNVTKEKVVCNLFFLTFTPTVVSLNGAYENQAMGIAAPSLTSFALDEMDDNQDSASQEDLIKITTVTAFSGKCRNLLNLGVRPRWLTAFQRRRRYSCLRIRYEGSILITIPNLITYTTVTRLPLTT